MPFLKNLSKWLFDFFFVVEEEKGPAELIDAAPPPSPVTEKPQAVIERDGAPAKTAKEPEAPSANARKAEDAAAPRHEAQAAASEDAGMLRALFDSIFAPAISFGDMQPEKRALTAQEKKAEAAEYARFKREMADRSPRSAPACIKALADSCHRELASLLRDGERVRKHGLSKAVICKSKGRYRARYERIPSYDMRRSDNLETLHIVDGEGRCYNNLGRAWAALKSVSQKTEFLKKLLNEDYGFDISDRELVKALFDARDETEKEKSEKHLKAGGRQ
jgi:hypothetical protein